MGDSVKIYVCISTGIWGHTPKIFCILESLRLLLVYSQVPENNWNKFLFLVHSKVQFSATVHAKRGHKQ